MDACNREEILAAFPPREKEGVRLPDLSTTHWEDLDFLGWSEPDRNRAFLVIAHASGLRGWTLQRMPVKVPNARRYMCAICLTVHGCTDMALFSRRVRGGRRYVSAANMLCGDLQCSLYVRGVKQSDAGQMPETVSLTWRIRRLRGNLDRLTDTLASLDAKLVDAAS